MSETKIVIPVRFSYPHVWKPKANEEGVEKYSCSLIISKKDKKTIAKINAAIEAAMEAGTKTLAGKKNIRKPLRDGDKDREGDGAYIKSYFLNASSDQQPGIVDEDKEPILDQREFYAGCHGYASVNFFAYNRKGNAGIGVGLNHVMKTKDGTPLTGRGSAADDFSNIEIEDEDNDNEASEFY